MFAVVLFLFVFVKIQYLIKIRSATPQLFRSSKQGKFAHKKHKYFYVVMKIKSLKSLQTKVIQQLLVCEDA